MLKISISVVLFFSAAGVFLTGMINGHINAQTFAGLFARGGHSSWELIVFIVLMGILILWNFPTSRWKSWTSQKKKVVVIILILSIFILMFSTIIGLAIVIAQTNKM